MILGCVERLARSERFELPTLGIEIRCSIQLSYERLHWVDYQIWRDGASSEAGGKLSFIGCYNGVIFISGQFPLVPPKLCVHSHSLSPASQQFDSVAVRLNLRTYISTVCRGKHRSLAAPQATSANGTGSSAAAITSVKLMKTSFGIGETSLCSRSYN